MTMCCFMHPSLAVTGKRSGCRTRGRVDNIVNGRVSPSRLLEHAVSRQTVPHVTGLTLERIEENVESAVTRSSLRARGTLHVFLKRFVTVQPEPLPAGKFRALHEPNV
jgi:hypothetical protein